MKEASLSGSGELIDGEKFSVSEFFNKVMNCIDYDQKTGAMKWKLIVDRRGRRHEMSGKPIRSLDSNGYVTVKINGKSYPAHRIAYLMMTGAFPEGQIDHINHIKNDNRWENIRVVSGVENSRNISMPKDNKSGIVGVSFNKKSGKWRASIGDNMKSLYLGQFHDFFDAICARKSAEACMGFHPLHGRQKEQGCEIWTKARNRNTCP